MLSLHAAATQPHMEDRDNSCSGDEDDDDDDDDPASGGVVQHAVQLQGHFPGEMRESQGDCIEEDVETQREMDRMNTGELNWPKPMMMFLYERLFR